MKQIVLLLILINQLSFSGCGRKTSFLDEITPPPPPPAPAPYIDPVVTKFYSLSENVSSSGSVDLDILWVIDNSGSMSSYQQGVIRNVDEFMKNFVNSSQLRWKMGLLSTALYENPYVGFDGNSLLDWKTPNSATVFANAVRRLGTSGDATERTFDPVLRHLRAFPNFLRPNAFLALIVVSDEDESSSINGETFLRELIALKGSQGQKVLPYGILQGNGTGQPRYYNFFQLAKGPIYNMHTNFGPTLLSIGQNLVQKISLLTSSILLSDRPKTGTLRVFYKNMELKPGLLSQGGQWVYDVQFNTIKILDTSMLDPKVKVFKVLYEPDL